MDEKYYSSGIECGACNGSGKVDDPKPLIEEVQKEPPLGEEMGKVLKYYAHPQVAWVELTSTIRVGEQIRIKGYTTDFITEISSMRINDINVGEAGCGQQVGIQVPDEVRRNDLLYRVD